MSRVFYYKRIRPNVSKVVGLTTALFFLVYGVSIASAQSRSYYYESILSDFVVNKDTTVDVKETQTYNFSGAYHEGERVIPLAKVDDISDVGVYELPSRTLLEWSPTALDKTDSHSWGKYTTYLQNGKLYIDWYFDAHDEKKSWIITYKLHGALGFLSDRDELYWNLFTDYTVPINLVEARVHIPQAVSSAGDLHIAFYDNETNADTKRESEVEPTLKSFFFKIENVSPETSVTIASGWPKGMVDRSVYFSYFIFKNAGYAVSLIVFLVTVVISLLYWYISEKYHKGKGTIIAQYEPPQHLPPAMAELIVKEKITDKAWPATVVDLAVRGYITITEEKGSIVAQVARVIIFVVLVGLVYVILRGGAVSPQEPNLAVIFVFVLAYIFIFIRLFYKSEPTLYPKEYILERVKIETDALKEYELTFLDALFNSGDYFSTKELKKSQSQQRELYIAMESLKKSLYNETEKTTLVYSVGPSKEIIKSYYFAGVSVLLFIIWYVVGSFSTFQTLVFISVLLLCFTYVYTFVFYDAKLNDEGVILKEEWLGFKLYLMTAEKYRMQNLTPDLFEKYLPYAIIFGVEKKWGEAFDSLNINPPTWYHGSYAGGFSSQRGEAGISSFSAGVFSASFSSSISSAFSSSGASGGSGGGGSAGGGGGGGGGGAS